MGGHLGPDTKYFHYDRAGSIILWDQFDPTDPWWGLRYLGYPEQPVIVGRTAGILRTFEVIVRIAPCRLPVLINGETGTGKELVAQALASARRGRFVPVNCSFPEGDLTLDAALYGRVDRIIYGAPAENGAFQLANGGTVFIDNIHCLGLGQQASLLRAIQSWPQYVQRVGSSVLEEVRARVVAGTNVSLQDLVRRGLFRKDLYSRLAVLQVCLAPLRARRDDIPLLTVYLLHKYRSEFGRPVTKVDRAAVARLCAHAWPLNIRELENVVQRALVLHKGAVLRAEELEFDSEESWAAPVPVPDVRQPSVPRSAETAPSRAEQVLSLVTQRPGSTAAELAGHMACSLRSVERCLKSLVEGGLVKKEKDDRDGRVFRYYPSARKPGVP